MDNEERYWAKRVQIVIREAYRDNFDKMEFVRIVTLIGAIITQIILWVVQ